MISRYSRERMEAIWSPENRYRKWLDIEILACEAMAKRGEIPAESLRNIREKAAFDVARIDEIEKTTKHDVIAFLTSVTEKVGEDGRFIHRGLTSSDILDTSLALLLREAAEILIEDLDLLLEVAGSMGIIPGTTICGLSDGAAWPVKNAISKFRGDFEDYINSRRATVTSAQQLMEVH